MDSSASTSQMADEPLPEEFVRTFSKKIKYYDSLFINSFPQRLNPKQLINYAKYDENKFIQFDLSHPELISDLSSVTAHLTCCVKEEKDDGILYPLEPGVKIGLAPGGLVSNAIRSMNLFIYQTQCSIEKNNRYSLISYIQQYFNKANVTTDDLNYNNAYYIDQSKADYLLTSQATRADDDLKEKQINSTGFYNSARFFEESNVHECHDVLHTPFLYSNLQFLLPTVSSICKFHL